MAMVVLQNPLTEIDGELGGNIFRWDQCRQHAQAPQRRINRDDDGRMDQNRAFRRCLTAWLSHPWTRDELDLWYLYCRDHPIQNKKGETTYMHPMLAFLSVNIKRILNGDPIIFTPPN